MTDTDNATLNAQALACDLSDRLLLAFWSETEQRRDTHNTEARAIMQHLVAAMADLEKAMVQ